MAMDDASNEENNERPVLGGKIGIIYALYCTYQTQPTQPKVKIRVPAGNLWEKEY
jgi:hypothetical protein